MAEEERKGNAEEVLYRTKIVQFLGRFTPIILQNDNGPCPLLAICNVLLLKNNLNLSMDVSEVSQKKLLSLVAERLLDSNSNVQDKDTEYLENQQQNIADAIDLLPRLATGIDVNLRFNKINDFEFTPECAIFDLLDIGLYHGWIVDPQDMDTASAIGLKSYNTLVAELVAHGTKNYEENGAIEEDSVDFAAATTATLGVPSPSLSRCRSFEDSPVSSSSNQRRKGDIEEEEELMRALKLSNSTAIPLDDHDHPQSETTTAVIPENFEKYDEIDQLVTDKMNACVECNDPNLSSEVIQYSQISSGHCLDPPILGETNFISTEKNDNITKDELITDETIPFCFSSGDISIDCYPITDHAHESGEPSILPSSQCDNTHSECEKVDDKSAFLSKSTLLIADSHSSDGVKPLDTLEKVCPNLEENEPIYEGEECILDPGLSIYRSREPMYEGEVVLAELADKGLENTCSPRSEVTNIQWELIRNFLESNASQLTIYGLFCLQEGLKERELCVFFRNNHFSTMFKLNGELYLLATDQGYFNQPALVWEKLNEVNGDTVFMTGNFKEFKTDGQVSEHWNEENAMTSTADYLASINRSDQSSDFSSDLQLAIQLQQQEFEHQSPRQSPSNFQQPAVEGRSRLVTGPQAPRSNYSTSKHESKQKEKCIIM